MRWLRRILIAVFVISALTIAGIWLSLRASLPQLDGAITAPGLSAAASIERDALGTVIVTAANRLDVSWALGYVHAQERYFEMDLLRRRAAGELSELLGSAAVEADRGARVHRFRSRIGAYFEALAPEQRQQMQRYAQGVNAGLDALGARPFPYLLLGQQPKPWSAEDSLLAPLAMYFNLQDADNQRELKLERMRATLPPQVFAFLTASGTEWDAPLLGAAIGDPAIPPADEIDLRQIDVAEPARDSPSSSEGIGSNNFAVAGSLTPHGGAIVANDMHLGLRVPNIWFRAELRFAGADGQPRVVTGATLPGTPFMVIGSNRHLAWGFTNSYGDWLDFVELQLDPEDPQRYLTPAGWQSIREFSETIAIAGAASEQLTVRETIFGPVVAQSSSGAPLALMWTAHHARGVNTELSGLEAADTIEQALAVARATGMPAQNLLLGSADGRIAWTVIGPIPRRAGGSDPRFPIDAASADSGWQGWYSGSDIPSVVDPPSGRLWSANARTVSGVEAMRIGDGGYTNGARARQIRDGLLAKQQLSEADLLAIQLDDRALFLERWHALLQQTLAQCSEPELVALGEAISDWNGRADADTRAYRLVRDFRLRTHQRFLQLFAAGMLEKDPAWSWPSLPQLDGAVWATVQQRPAHLLPRNFSDWDAWLRAAALDVVVNLSDRGSNPADATWGKLNTTAIRHPLSSAIPFAGWLLDMPAQALDGDQYLPRVQGPKFGASERMVVAPGHEELGYFHMPGGQSGHPLSPFYGAGHEDWAAGRASPFLPGPAIHSLTLTP
ncbi:MAG TPA: penicillin acylase family protein, partial [Xanthomonadales bacterium]|nr:penicillin acylase family protein [Xanthomonadales bacterium]